MKMLKPYLLFLLVVGLVGCGADTTSPPQDLTGNFVMPEEMVGCKVVVLPNSKGRDLIVVVCPNLVTNTIMTVPNGKFTTDVTTAVVPNVRNITDTKTTYICENRGKDKYCTKETK